MDATRWMVLAGVALAACSAHLTAGCFNYADDCTYTLQCNSTSTGTGGGDGGVPTGCDPTQTTSAVADSCGLFVSPMGDDNNTGSQMSPLKTLSRALAMGGSTIYACDGSTPYSEAVTVSKDVNLFGALDCSTWVFSAGHKSLLTAPAGMVPLSLTAKAGGTAVHYFAITSADATAPGGSSIAVLDDSAAATFDNVDVTAGKGADGAAGAMPPAQVMTAMTANGGTGANDMGCNMSGTLGGAPGINMCSSTSTNGGVGGQGIIGIPGSAGGDGQPMSTPSNGGVGQGMGTPCGAGMPGTMGANGMPGTGAQGIGGINNAGYEAPVATMGMTAGGPGQGGGGGGSAVQCSASAAGPSGGGGGAGGCGGNPGAPGVSGGSSIGILVLSTSVNLASVTITTHAGGAGGVGGNGQTGGNGGTGGQAGAMGACAGGAGGQGGNGGGGGGGAGGHSVGIAVKGAMPPDLKTTMIALGVGGVGGMGGNMDMTTTTLGSTGMACKTLDFDPTATMACAM